MSCKKSYTSRQLCWWNSVSCSLFCRPGNFYDGLRQPTVWRPFYWMTGVISSTGNFVMDNRASIAYKGRRRCYTCSLENKLKEKTNKGKRKVDIFLRRLELFLFFLFFLLSSKDRFFCNFFFVFSFTVLCSPVGKPPHRNLKDEAFADVSSFPYG